MDNSAMPSGRSGRAQRIVPILLVACVMVVAFWEFMASRSRRPFSPFQITGAEFRTFAPASPLWSVRPLQLPANPTEPNIVAFELHAGTDAAAAPVLVRLVHGYNMCDCMRIKGYKVELLEDRRGHGAGSMEAPGNSAAGAGGAPAFARQVWRLTSATGQASIWITAMIRAGDFSETDVDVRSLAFPRIGIPDDPRWVPRGLTWSSLRHPIRNSRDMLRAKWNNSRCDLATFLGLRQPAWADDELLTLVAAWNGPPVERADESRVTERVLAAAAFLYGELKQWRTRSGPDAKSP